MPFFTFLSQITRRVFLRSMRFKVQPELDNRRPIVFLCNHVSTLDTWILLGILDELTGSRTLVLSAPQVGRLVPFAKSRLIAIDRGSDGPVKALKEMRKALRSGSNLLIFPEGTHHTSFDSPGPIRAGIPFLLRGLPHDTSISFIGLHYYVFRSFRMSLVVHIEGSNIATRALGLHPSCENFISARIQDVIGRARNFSCCNHRQLIPYPFAWFRGKISVSDRWKEDL